MRKGLQTLKEGYMIVKFLVVDDCVYISTVLTPGMELAFPEQHPSGHDT